MKYIKKFSTNADYQAFTEGGGYVTPNVCYIEENESVAAKPEKITFPLYIGDFNLVGEEWGTIIYTKEGNFTKLVNLLRSTVLSNGIEYEKNLYLNNLTNYGIEIYIDCKGVWYPIDGLRLTENNLYLSGENFDSYIDENIIHLTIENMYEPVI